MLDPATGIEVTNYIRGLLAGMNKVLDLPDMEMKNQQRQAKAEADKDFEGAAAGVFPTRALRRRLPRFRAGAER